MTRPLVFGNPRFHVGMDPRGDWVDLYYPFVGYPNHGHRISLGVYDLKAKKMSWIREGWELSLKYYEDVPIGLIEALSKEFELKITITSFVHYSKNILWNRIKVINLSKSPKNLRLFMYHDLHLKENPFKDTAMLDKRLEAIIHYKDDVYFAFGSIPSFNHFAVGIKEWAGLEGTWRDADDGSLSGNMVSHGLADSCIGWDFEEPFETKKIDHYGIVANSFKEMEANLIDGVKEGFEKSLEETKAYWLAWLSKSNFDFGLDDKVDRLLKRSLTLLKLLISENGSIVASTDFEIIRYVGDNYNYIWPRDACYCAEALDAWGYYGPSAKIFDFLFNLITEKGYFLHKYYPTGNFGSTWHPVPFIQIDQTGSFLHAFWKHYSLSKKIDQVAKNWDKIVRMGEFLAEWRDKYTGLPKPSWDLWEDRKAVSTYSCCAVYGGLMAAGKLAEVMGREDYKDKDYFRKNSEEVKNGILNQLYDDELNRFIKSVNPRNESLDASLFAIFYFNVLPAEDPRVINTMEEVERELWVKKGVGGIARYKGDLYFRTSEEIIGNPWILTTLYLSIFYSEIGNLKKAKSLIDWVTNFSFELLPEQINPFSGEAVSVLPLAWSHAAFAVALSKFISKLKERNLSWKAL